MIKYGVCPKDKHHPLYRRDFELLSLLFQEGEGEFYIFITFLRTQCTIEIW